MKPLSFRNGSAHGVFWLRRAYEPSLSSEAQLQQLTQIGLLLWQATRFAFLLLTALGKMKMNIDQNWRCVRGVVFVAGGGGLGAVLGTRHLSQKQNIKSWLSEQTSNYVPIYTVRVDCESEFPCKSRVIMTKPYGIVPLFTEPKGPTCQNSDLDAHKCGFPFGFPLNQPQTG